MTQFAVATEKQAEYLREVKDIGSVGQIGRDRPYLNRGWVERHAQGRGVQLTTPGRLALELREALGPDRSLTKAGAKALVIGAPTRATKIRLMDDGLLERRGFCMTTEDGHRIREILLKHRVTF